MTMFINPYNFVPFEKNEVPRVNKADKYSNKKLCTGWLDVSMYVKTPLIIPDGAHVTYINPKNGKIVDDPTKAKKDELHGKMNFIRKNGKCFVPGSEIRGMIRAIYEATTNSCVRDLASANPISQRVPTFSSLNKRGLLGFEGGKWVLYDTRKEVVEKFPRDNEDAKAAKAAIMNWEEDTGTNYKDGSVLQYNIPVSLSDKQPYTIYKLHKGDIVASWSDSWPYDKLMSALKRDGVHGNDSNGKCHIALSKLLEAIKDGKMPGKYVPVYYFDVTREITENNNKKEVRLIYLSGSAIGRIGNRREWKDVFGDHTPCSGPDFCPACLLFGTIKKEGLKGKVRFSDAYVDEDVKGEYRTLDILGGPRQTAFEFYYEKPDKNAKYWNMDFYSSQLEKNAPTTFYDLAEATPRGRKMYWHSQPLTANAPISHMNSTMEFIKPEKPFTFKIYFDQITEEQLSDLKWAITLGNNKADSNIQLKIGHGKPLGYGSVKLVIDKENIRDICADADSIGYKISCNDVDEKVKSGGINVNSTAVLNLLAMADTEKTKDKLVSYPYACDKKGNSTIFNWFVDNRKNANKLKALPHPTDTDIQLDGNGSSDDIIDAKVASCNVDNKAPGKYYVVFYSNNKRYSANNVSKQYAKGDVVKVKIINAEKGFVKII